MTTAVLIGQRRTIAILFAVGVVLVGCGDDDTDAVDDATTTTASDAAGTSYTSDGFAVPLTVTVDDALESPPDPESANLLSWADGAGGDDAIRFLVPVEVYRPRSATPEAPPADFAAFVRGLTAESAEITDVTDTAVGGRPATLMTVSRVEDEGHPSGYLDGSLGCPERGADQFDGCFGPQPDLLLRLAIIDVGDDTLLAWARVSKDAPDAEFIETFEQMLTTVEFQ